MDAGRADCENGPNSQATLCVKNEGQPEKPSMNGVESLCNHQEQNGCEDEEKEGAEIGEDRVEHDSGSSKDEACAKSLKLRILLLNRQALCQSLTNVKEERMRCQRTV